MNSTSSMPAAPCAGFPALAQRALFPALERAGDFVFFDNAAGAQVPQSVLDAVIAHLLDHNVQRGGRYRHSIAVDATIRRAREAVADLVNAEYPEEIAFGLNATSFIRTISLAIGDTLRDSPGGRDELIVTELDHAANVATWRALEARGARVRVWPIRDDGTLDVAELAPLVGPRTRLVACTLASNALGSIVDVRAAARVAHAAGAELFVDAVHYSPHGPIDVRALECDYLVCSGYKVFAPHMGFLWGRRELLRRLPTFREAFIPDEPPYKIEAGTFAYENVAGMEAAVIYLEQLGATLRAGAAARAAGATRRSDVRFALDAIRDYEQTLSLAMLAELAAAGAVVYGIADPAAVARRVPTLCFNLPGRAPAAVCEALAAAGIGVRDGHMYAPHLMTRLGLDAEQGAVRASLLHYNTAAEVARFGRALRAL